MRERRGAEGQRGDISPEADRGGRRNLCDELCDLPWAIDLATVPKNDHRRFVESVTNGRNNMPPWGDVLNPEDVEALWAYFSTGEK